MHTTSDLPPVAGTPPVVPVLGPRLFRVFWPRAKPSAHLARYIRGQGSPSHSEQSTMTIFQKILSLLTPADRSRKEAKPERAEQTKKAIERYDAMLNTTVSDRRGRPHTMGR
jgi:hypothetical protein